MLNKLGLHARAPAGPDQSLVFGLNLCCRSKVRWHSFILAHLDIMSGHKTVIFMYVSLDLMFICVSLSTFDYLLSFIIRV